MKPSLRFFVPLGQFWPHLTSKKEGDQTPERTQPKLFPQGEIWGKRSRGEPPTKWNPFYTW